MEKSVEGNVPFLFADFHLIFQLIKELPEYQYSCLEVEIRGYEIYIAEQWCLDREPTTVIISYTGDPTMTVKCCKVYLPLNPSKWPTLLQHYYKFIENCKQLKYINRMGYLFVSDIHDLNFDYQNLNLIPVPIGDVRRVWHNFTNNINLRRLHCGGRSSNMLQPPVGAALDKFYQLFKIVKKPTLNAETIVKVMEPEIAKKAPKNNGTSVGKAEDLAESYPVYSVVEIVVYIAQISLRFCNLLDIRYVDGFFCHKTERALYKWQKTYGALYFPALIHQTKLLTPSILAALISLMLVSFYKLKIQNCLQQYSAIPDPYIEPRVMYTAIYHFQKKLTSKKVDCSKASYLDIALIDKLFQVTENSDANDFSNLKKLVKTTVKDISVTAGINGIGVSMGAGSAMFSLASTDNLTNNIDDLVKTINTFRAVFNTSIVVDTTELKEERAALNKTKNKSSSYATNLGSPTFLTHTNDDGLTRALTHINSNSRKRSKNSILVSNSAHSCKGSLLGWLWDENNKTMASFFYNDFIWFDYSKHFDADYEYFFQEQTCNAELCLNQGEQMNRTFGISHRSSSDNKEQDNDYYENLGENSDEKLEKLKVEQFYACVNAKKHGNSKSNGFGSKTIGKGKAHKNTPEGNGIEKEEILEPSKLEEITERLKEEQEKEYEKEKRKILYDPEFRKELTRSKSTNDLLLNSEGTYRKASQVLQRTHSFSNVQDYFEDFDKPLSFVRFAIDFKKLNTLKCQTFINDESKLPKKLRFLQTKLLPNVKTKYDDLKYQYENELETKMSIATKQKRQLESVVSKYNYDIRLLERRMRNVSEALEQFELKAHNTKKQLLEAAKMKGILYLEELSSEGMVTDEEINAIFFSNTNTSSQQLKKKDERNVTDIKAASSVGSNSLNQTTLSDKIELLREKQQTKFKGFVFSLANLLWIIAKAVYFKMYLYLQRNSVHANRLEKDKKLDKI
ncbi:hypothetical protein ACO0QE_002005 [Hanseniaspora vineae]